MARWIEKGEGIKKDAVLAAANYIRAMRLDSPRAPRLLWEMIQNEKFFTQLKLRVDAGDPVAQYVWAELAAVGFDHQITDEQAWNLLKAAADQKYEPAMIESGMNYFVGFWVKQDKNQALELWKEAADLGSLEARIRSVTAQTVGVPGVVIPSDTLSFLFTSAKNGSVLAQALLGYCYEAGVGVTRSKTIAAGYYREAAQRGSQIAFKGLRRMYDEIRPKEKEFQVGE
jgi:TPR repeat protein